MRGTAGTILLISALAAGSASAQSKVGTTMGQFLGIEPSARNAAMGNAGAALGEGLESVYFNPGAAGILVRPALMFTHALWFADISYDYAAAAVPIGNVGTVFVSVTSLGSGDIDVRTVNQPLGTGERYDVGNTAIAVGYGRQITSRFAAGAKITYVNERIWNTSENAVTFSFGTVYRLSENGVRLGSHLSNLSTRSRFSGRDLAIRFDDTPGVAGDNSALPAEQFTDEFPLPIQFRVGLSYPHRVNESNRLLLLVDALHPSDNTESFNAGAEWSWHETLALRAGYQTMFQEDSELGLTLGLGLQGVFRERRFHADYAWADHERLQETHRMTLILDL